MSKENSRWDKLLLLVCLVAVVLGNVLAAPFYPEYTRRVNSLADLKRRFVHSNIVFPDLGENEATEYALLLSSRTVLAKPIGYIISWNEDVDGAPHFCLLICGKDQKEGSIRSLESYRGITIYESSNGCSFTLNEKCYSLECWNANDMLSSVSADVEKTNVEKQTMTAYAEQLIDASAG